MVQMGNKVYYSEITLLKGIAILLVVIGHSQPSCIDQSIWFNSLIRYIIAVPQMPMFFVASGFLFSELINWKDFFGKKVRRLLVPYVSFGAIVMLLHIVLAKYTISGTYSFKEAIIFLFTGGTYWFLYVLFLIMMVVRLCRFHHGYLILALSCIVVSLIFDDMSLFFTRFFNYMPFFIAGIYIRRYYPKIRLLVYNYLPFFTIVAGILFIITYLVMPVTVFIGRILGTSVFLFLCMYINEKSSFGRLASYFGKYSLQYYINHLLIGTVAIKMSSLFIFDSPLSGYVQWLIVFLLMMTFSLIGLEIQKRSKYLRLISGL